MKTRILCHPSSKYLNEKELILALINGDEQAFRKLYKMYSASLLGVITKIVIQREIAEDLLQDCFVKISKSIVHYDQAKGRLFTWMLNIARNIAIDHIRLVSSKNGKKTFELDDVRSELMNKPAEQFNIDTIGLKKLIDQLCTKHREMIHLAYFQGYTHAEIADLLQMPLGSVKTAIRLAIVALRKRFCFENGGDFALSA
ncbi:RNA polymerase sigma factor [Pedobacter kyungheensis]|uniref:RNA polymerase sigma factor n=1 Tax=Pedobacter kyungheensis TaxID=1069985 RepID=UPI0009E5E063|nr:sigma-70 family RNA polymerase sigma factor [Pedobacter kyungheensis]